jgi:hypothetical protein
VVLARAVEAAQRVRNEVPCDLSVVGDTLALERDAARLEVELRAVDVERSRRQALEVQVRIQALAVSLFQATDRLNGCPRLSAAERQHLGGETVRLRAELDRLLRETAPTSETLTEREARYWRWRRLTRRPGLTVAERERVTDRGFRETGFDS